MLRIPFRLIGNLFRLLAYLWSSFWFAIARRFRARSDIYLEYELESSYDLGSATRGLRKWLGKDSPSFIQLRHMIKRACSSDEVSGVILRCEGVAMGPARAADLADQIDRLRHAGKHVVMQTDSASLRDMQVLSAADDVLLTPAGRLYLFGIRIDELFGRKLLDRLGVQGQFIHIGAFKTATHRLHKDGMTQPQRLMMTSLHDGLMEQSVLGIAGRRGLEATAIRGALATSPLDAEEAMGAGLVDGTSFWEEARHWLVAERAADLVADLKAKNWRLLDAPRQLSADLPEEDVELASAAQMDELREHEDFPRDIRTIDAEKFTGAIPRLEFKRLWGRRPYIAVLDFTGAIVMDAEGPSPIGAGSSTIRADEAVQALKDVRGDARCIGVLMHVNSPGGSALASDIIWRQISLTREAKPLVCYCSDVAASGGYYLASGADKILCRPESITGSIGVITGKVSFGQALEKLDVGIESIYDHDNDLFTSPFHALPPSVMTSLRDDARAFYRRFLERVGQARGIARSRLHRYGRGHVYTGVDAHQRSLVDQLGGLEEAIASIYDLCETTESKAPLTYIEHRDKNLRDVLSSSILASPSPWARGAAALERLLSPARIAAWLEREPLLAILPYDIELHR